MSSLGSIATTVQQSMSATVVRSLFQKTYRWLSRTLALLCGVGSAVLPFNRYACKPFFERTRNTSLVFLSELGDKNRRLSDFSLSEKSWECPSCSECWY